MKTHLSHTLINTLSRVTARFGGASRAKPAPAAMPDHVMRRLESVFDAMSELSFQPDIAGAGNLICDTLQAELPTAAVAAGVYHIDSDEIRIVAARGLDHELLHGTVMPRERCFAGRVVEEAVVVRGDEDGVNWLGTGEEDSTVLLCPIVHDSHLLGVLALAEPLCSAEFSHHDRELLGYMAGQLGTFIQAHRMRPSIVAPAPANRG